ncbi:MAG: hypothetical protein ABI573_10660 [Chloroflexota bacterium]
MTGSFTSLDSYAGKAIDPLSMNRFLYAEGNPSWLRRSLLLLLVATLPLLAMFPTSVLARDPALRGSLVVFELAIVVMLAAFAIGSAVASSRAMARERRAGYTTYGKGNLDLWYLDDRTGEVLRRPDERARR